MLEFLKKLIRQQLPSQRELLIRAARKNEEQLEELLAVSPSRGHCCAWCGVGREGWELDDKLDRQYQVLVKLSNKEKRPACPRGLCPDRWYKHQKKYEQWLERKPWKKRHLMSEIKVPEGTAIGIAITDGKLTASYAEARRLVAQGAVKLDGIKVEDLASPMTVGTHTIRVGKTETAIVVEE